MNFFCNRSLFQPKLTNQQLFQQNHIIRLYHSYEIQSDMGFKNPEEPLWKNKKGNQNFTVSWTLS